MNTETIRELFERWYEQEHGYSTLVRTASGDYDDDRDNALFNGFEAGFLAASSKAEGRS